MTSLSPRAPAPRAARAKSNKGTAMVDRLVEATIAEISERGLAATTVRSIAGRAGVSQGAIFAHFPSRGALVAATAREVSRRQAAMMTDLDFGDHADPLQAIVETMRASARGQLNVIWYEMLIAARTSEEFRDEVADVLVEHRRVTFDAGVEVAGRLMPGADECDLRALVVGIVAMFDGEAIVSVAISDEETDRLVERLLRLVGNDVIGRLGAASRAG